MLDPARMIFFDDARSYLRQEYQARHARNPAYSWRSYARDLSLSPSMLSEVLKGRYGLSRGKAQTVAATLKLDPDHTDHFIDLLEAHFHRQQSHRELARLRADVRLKNPNTHLHAQTLKQMLNWTYFAALEILEVGSGHFNLENVLKPFRRHFGKLEFQVQKLKALGLANDFGPTDRVSVAQDHLLAKDVDQINKEILDLARTALSELDQDEIDATSCFASLRRDDVPEFRRELSEAFMQLLNKYSSGDGCDSVYVAALQTFPIYVKDKNSPTS